MPTQKGFPKGKSAKQLGIDTSRKFVTLEAEKPYYDKGAIVSMVKDDGDHSPQFLIETGKSDGDREWYISWSNLAYADSKPQKSDVDVVAGMLSRWIIKETLDPLSSREKQDIRSLAQMIIKKLNK